MKMDPLNRIALWLLIAGAAVLASYIVAFLVWDLDSDIQLMFHIAVFVPVLVSMAPMLMFYRRNMSLTSVMNGEDYDDEEDRESIARIRKAIKHRYDAVFIVMFMPLIIVMVLRLFGVIADDIPNLILIGPMIFLVGIGSLLRENAVRNASLRWKMIILSR